jgi:CHRD domain
VSNITFRGTALYEMEASMARSRLLSVTSLALLLLSTSVYAEAIMFKADMKGATEVPPTNSPANGNAMVTLDTAGKTLAWKITYSGLTGDATAAHFHGPAAPGANAGPVVDISGKIAEGSATLTDQQMVDLQAGKWYLNIHTAKFPNGEIRGQVEPAKQ